MYEFPRIPNFILVEKKKRLSNYMKKTAGHSGSCRFCLRLSE